MKPTFMVLLFLLGPALGLAQAQEGYDLEPTGTVSAMLGGQERSWHTVLSQAPGVKVNTANWSFFEAGPVSFYSFSLQAYPPSTKTTMDLYDSEGTLDLAFMFMGELPAACPCALDDASITYSASDSLSDDKYLSDETALTLSEFRRTGEDTFAITGEFSATLYYRAEPMAEPDPDDTLAISGSFEVRLDPAGNQVE